MLSGAMTKSMPTRYLQISLSFQSRDVRLFSSKPPLTIEMIQDRVLLVLKLYDKINPREGTFLLFLEKKKFNIIVNDSISCCGYQ